MRFRAKFSWSFIAALAVLCSACSDPEGGITPVDLSQLTGPQLVFELARTGDIENLQSLVEEFPDAVKIRGDDGETALHEAAMAGQDDVVEFLLEQGADPTAVDNDGQTPADAARQEGYLSLADSLSAAASSNAG